ncbi:hypothetical protein Ade02nite_90490 [Paractinoplanes deccanensis]|uniref:Uncharacterized protein n=1 Tax=Paractinoplanes deccanensis TaxID=113561 RepID=A0ABQ3YK80_9ACTN|nr:hypothetical protein Ade02nite_90490 [Actinoplanes deccanensis]
MPVGATDSQVTRSGNESLNSPKHIGRTTCDIDVSNCRRHRVARAKVFRAEVAARPHSGTRHPTL